MKKLPLLGLLGLLICGGAHADEETRKAQTELKSQGFFYGETDGRLNSETSAAIKRFQIRNGLEVTGTLTKQTLEGLDLAPAAAPSAPSAPRSTKPAPPVDLRREQSVQESDRTFLRRQENTSPPAADPSIVPAPTPLEPPAAPGEEYAALFARTPYASAPRVVQENVLRKAQTSLARGGHYRDAIDGVPGPATEEALLSYQSGARLPLTGQLDLQTLAQLRLLPTRAINAPSRPFRQAPQRPAQRAYRGIWIE